MVLVRLGRTSTVYWKKVLFVKRWLLKTKGWEMPLYLSFFVMNKNVGAARKVKNSYRGLLFWKVLAFLTEILVQFFMFYPSSKIMFYEREHRQKSGCRTFENIGLVVDFSKTFFGFCDCKNYAWRVSECPIFFPILRFGEWFYEKCYSVFSFFAKISDFLDFLPRFGQLIMARNSSKIKILARNPRSCH